MDVFDFVLSYIACPVAVVYIVRYIDNMTKKNNR